MCRSWLSFKFATALFENAFRQLSSKVQTRSFPFNHVDIQGPHQNPSLYQKGSQLGQEDERVLLVRCLPLEGVPSFGFLHHL